MVALGSQPLYFLSHDKKIKPCLSLALVIWDFVSNIDLARGRHSPAIQQYPDLQIHRVLALLDALDWSPWNRA